MWQTMSLMIILVWWQAGSNLVCSQYCFAVCTDQAVEHMANFWQYCADPEQVKTEKIKETRSQIFQTSATIGFESRKSGESNKVKVSGSWRWPKLVLLTAVIWGQSTATIFHIVVAVIISTHNYYSNVEVLNQTSQLNAFSHERPYVWILWLSTSYWTG